MNQLTVTFSDAANLIHACGDSTTVLLRGQPGIGKSSILKELARMRPDYLPCYVDAQQLDLGDLGMPVIDRDAMATYYAPNARFGLARGQTRPVLLMLDELTKASRPVLNMLLPVILERRLGDVELPTGSIVFATGNLDTDGVADTLPAHAYNRMTVVRVANPDSDAWINWAMNNGVAPEVMAFAKEYPQVFDCYVDLDEKDNNPYIFNPRAGQTRAFCSPRSLEKASNLIRARSALGNALLPALAGTVGEAGARDMEAMVHLADQIPSFDVVIKDPAKTRLPDGVAATFLMAFMLAGRVKDETLTPVLEYVNRWESFEGQTLFITSLASNATKVGFACKNRKFQEMAAKFGKYF
jgi:hypothetical protein